MSAFIGGGAQRDMVLLCNALAAKGVAVTFLVLRDEGPLRPLLDPAIPVIEIGAHKLRYAIPALRRAIRDLAPAAVVSSEASFNLCTLIAVRTLPRQDRATVILREAGSPSIAQYRDPYRQHRIAYRILRRLYRHADRIIALTAGARRRSGAEFFRTGANRLRHAFQCRGAVGDRQAPRAVGRRIRPRPAISSSASGGCRRKRIIAHCCAPSVCSRRNGRGVSLIVGEGPERTALETLAHQLGIAGRVVFTGPVADPFPWMMQARVAVCSSLYEGLGNAIIEALACGTPVVSTDCPYGPREILQDGRYGRLTPIGDAVAMAEAIAAALDAVPDRRALMRRGLDYTAERAAEAFLDIAAEVAATAPNIKRPLALAVRS